MSDTGSGRNVLPGSVSWSPDFKASKTDEYVPDPPLKHRPNSETSRHTSVAHWHADSALREARAAIANDRVMHRDEPHPPEMGQLVRCARCRIADAIADLEVALAELSRAP